MRRYINNDGLRLITQFEGAPRLKARLCEGGRYELSYGVTFYPDGSPVKEGDTCTDSEALDMFRAALDVFEKGVSDLVQVDLNDNQFSACVALSYNIGLEQFARSTVLREINARRFDDAAAAFGMWVFATKGGYTQAYRGLLRRQYATACLFLGYDWVAACADEAIALQREKPASLPGKDRVIYKTAFHDVLKVAQRYPLAPATEPAPEAKPAPAVIPDSARAIPDTPAPQPAPNPPAKPEAKSPPVKAGGEEGAALDPTAPQPTSPPPRITVPASPPPPVKTVEAPKPAPPVVVAGQDGVKPKSPNTLPPEAVPYKIDPNAGLKPLEESDRAKGYVIQQVGIGVIRLGSLGVFGSTIQGGAQVVQGDPVLSNIILMAFVAGGIALVGYVIKTYGEWKKKRGEEKASQGLF